MRVDEVLRGVEVWPPTLAPTADFVPLSEWDAAAVAGRAAQRMRAPARVGASAVVMGLVARLWTVLLVPPARAHRALDLDRLVVSDEEGSVRLGLTHLAWAPGTATPEGVRATLLALLEPLIGTTGLATGLAWGNVAASLHAVPRLYGDDRLVPWVQSLLAEAPLTGRLEARGGRIRRRSCCLFYLAEGGGLCGDCCFDTVPG